MQYESLVADLTAALERGDVDPLAVERLLRRGAAARRTRPDVAGVLRAAGALVSFAGAAALYAIGFDGYAHAIQLVTPFAFPAAALGAAVGLHRADRPAWEVELAGMVGYLALGIAELASGVAAGAGSGGGVLASLAATAVVLVMHRAVGIVRLTGWGLSASLVSLTGFLSDLAGALNGSTAGWWLGVQAVVAIALGALLLARRSRESAENAWRTAALLALFAGLAGIAHTGSGQVGPWHLVLTAAVAATLVAAAHHDMPGLMWTGVVGALAWMGALALVVGRSGGWAVAAIALGAGLLALAALIGRTRGRPVRPGL